MDFDNTDQIKALADLPPEPKKAPPKWNGWSSPLRALPAAAAEVLAGAGEVATVAGRGLVALRDAPRWPGMTRADRERADAQALAGVTGKNEFSRSLRDVSEHYSPDPATAGTAENVVFQGVRGLGKAIGYVTTMGPAGIVPFAADEGLTETDRLQRQGVDDATAHRVGALTGVVNIAGAAVPVAPLAKGFTPSNLAKVGGLGLLSGPATFAAQQQLTKDILAGAGYKDLAAQHDPLDPVGLAVSVVAPWAFGVASLRAPPRVKLGKPAEAPREPVAEPAHEVVQTHETVDAAMVHNLTLKRAADEARAADVKTEVGQPIETLQQFVQRSGFKPEPMPEPPRSNFLAWIKANGGLDLAEKLDITGEPSGVRSNPAGIFRKGGATRDDLATRAADEGYLPRDQGADSAAFVDLVKRAIAGDPVLTLEQHAQRAAHEAAQAETAYRVDALERRLRVLGVDPEAAKGNATALDAYLKHYEDRLLSTALDDAKVRTEPEPRAKSDAAQRAAQAYRDLTDSGDAPQAFLDRAGLAPEVRNLVVGLAEMGGDAKRAEGLLADFDRTSAARPNQQPVDVAADVVEAARVHSVVTPEPAAAPKPTDPVARSVLDRVAAIEQTMPELKVDDGRTAAEFMAAAKREAQEGTADALGLVDADLVRVASECALMVSAA
jgi:hypothetical protein